MILNTYTFGLNNNKNVYFQGYKSAFSKKLEEALTKNVLTPQEDKKLVNLLTNAYKRALKGGMLGEGYNSSAFRLDDYYVALIGSMSKEDPIFSHFQKGFLGKTEPDYNLKTYFGNTVATFGEIKIKKNALIKNKGINAGTPINFDTSKKKEYFKEVTLPEFASLPQRAYDNLAKDMLKLIKADKRFDYMNPNNFIKTGKSIRVVDDLKKYDGKDILQLMGDLFLDSVHVMQKYGFDANVTKVRKTIFKKCILAALKTDFTIDRNKIRIYDYFCQICGIEKQFYDIIMDLNKLKFDTPKNKYLKVAKEYLDTL